MAERLTTRFHGILVKEADVSKIQVITKLGQLEDIMDKYGIDIQNLDYMLEDYSKNQGRDFAVCEERDTLRQERDVWKRACELACEHISTVHIITNDDMLENQDNLPQYFYQQAKKESESK